MTPITRAQKIYFAAVGLLALWVGFWGYFLPAQVDIALPWLVPPLHARFLGSMYLSGCTFMVGGLLSRHYAEVRVMVPAIAVWTGMLLLVSFFYLSEFDFGHGPVWFWFGAYIVYPLISLWLTWGHRAVRERVPGPALPAWVRGYLLAQGALVTALALSLLLLPDLMASVWPWKITRMLAQMYAAPFLSYGFTSLMLAREQTWPEARVVLAATFVFALGVLLASIIHNSLFSILSPAAWLWFGGFGLAAVVLGLMTVLSMRKGTPS